MAQARFYANTAVPTTLTANIGPANTVINVASSTGYPTTPFGAALDYGTPSEEVVLVTAVAGTVWTVTRAYDGTSATSHNVGAPVRHTWIAADGNDARAHEGTGVNVHGISALSNVVGTTDIQTLTNKTLTAPTITGNVPGNPAFTAGFRAGGANQLTVDSSGKISSTTMTSTHAESGVSATTSSLVYADATVVVSTTITCPPSGKVWVTGDVSQFINTFNFSLRSGIEATGSVSGTLRAVNDANALNWIQFDANDTGIGFGSQTYIITSANPGETITLTWKHRVTGATAQMDYRSISAMPLLG